MNAPYAGSLDTERRRCGDVWGGACQVWVHAPYWAHGGEYGHPNASDMARVAGDPNAPSDILVSLARWACEALARKRGTDEHWWERWGDDSGYVDRGLRIIPPLLENPHTPPQAVTELSKAVLARGKDDYYDNLAKSPGATPKTLVRLYRRLQRKSPERRDKIIYALAGNPNVPPRILARILRERCEHISEWRHRAAIAARNPRLPRKLLERLLRNEDADVRRAAAAGPGLSLSAIARLAADQDPGVRQTVAGHPSITPDILADMAEREESAGVRLAIAQNPKTPPGVLLGLALDDESEEVRTAASNNPNMSEALQTAILLQGAEE